MPHTRDLLAALGGVLVTVGLGSAASACRGTPATATTRTLSVEQLATAMQIHPSLVVLDTNGAETREQYGVIPGARLLSGASFDPARELPADKAQILVFYCSSPTCRVAPAAAQRAVESGWLNVYVLDAGIKGWTEAGHPTAKVGRASPPANRPPRRAPRDTAAA